MADIGHLEAALSPVVTDHAMELVDLEFRAERSGWVLRLFVDRPGGVTVDDCAQVSRDCSVILDAEELIDQRFRLEVSSPGIERRLRKQHHFEQVIGEQVRVEMRNSAGGRKRVTGELVEVGDEEITVETDDGQRVTVTYDNIKRANLKVF